jgi:phosphoglucosamine mutase
VRVADKSLAQSEAVQAAVERESAALNGTGRVLLRPSGTEPLVRVMVEAQTADQADAACSRLVAVLEDASAPL